MLSWFKGLNQSRGFGSGSTLKRIEQVYRMNCLRIANKKTFLRGFAGQSSQDMGEADKKSEILRVM